MLLKPLFRGHGGAESQELPELTATAQEATNAGLLGKEVNKSSKDQGFLEFFGIQIRCKQQLAGPKYLEGNLVFQCF